MVWKVLEGLCILENGSSKKAWNKSEKEKFKNYKASDEDTVIAEMTESRGRIEDRLGMEIVIFGVVLY